MLTFALLLVFGFPVVLASPPTQELVPTHGPTPVRVDLPKHGVLFVLIFEPELRERLAELLRVQLPAPVLVRAPEECLGDLGVSADGFLINGASSQMLDLNLGPKSWT